MGSAYSYMWSDQGTDDKPAAIGAGAAYQANSSSDKYKHGIGPSSSIHSSQADGGSSGGAGGSLPPKGPRPKANTISTPAQPPKKKKGKGKVNKAMIGTPANFQHTAHIGASDMFAGSKTGTMDMSALKAQMGGGSMYSSSAPASPQGSPISRT